MSYKVSVIMPFLNSIAYLEECMDSVINQSLKEIEIICVDAGSTDGTLEVLNEYAQKDCRIKIINSPKKSYGYQINLGLDAAQGEYFGIVESDDYIKENMYETLYDVAREYHCDAVKSDFCIFVEENDKNIFTYRKMSNKKEFYDRVFNPLDDLYSFRLNGVNTPGIYNMQFMRKENIKLNETPGASYQDNGLWFQIFSLAKRVYVLNEAFYMIRRDNPNSSVKSKEKVYCMCEEYDFIREFLASKPDVEKMLAPVCAYFRFGNYWFTLDRIADEFKLEFCMKFSEDIKKIISCGEFDKSLYSTEQIERLMFIMKEPKKYYYKSIKFHNQSNNMFAKCYYYYKIFGLSKMINKIINKLSE